MLTPGAEVQNHECHHLGVFEQRKDRVDAAMRLRLMLHA
jgi:hypothetical protein